MKNLAFRLIEARWRILGTYCWHRDRLRRFRIYRRQGLSWKAAWNASRTPTIAGGVGAAIVAAIAGAAVAATTAGIVIAAVINAVIMIAVSFAIGAITKAIQGDPSAKGGGKQDREQMVMVRAPAAPRTMVYGRMRVGGIIGR